MQIALAGNPNCGKTTLFNALTGSHYTVGNWSGVTVEKKEGYCSDMNIIDLPGIYSLSTGNCEEVIARDYLINERPDLILNIVDATNLERNLYLTLQLVNTNIPVVIALNMTDVLVKNGISIDIEKLKKRLGIPVVAISALKGIGIEKLIDVCRSRKNVQSRKIKSGQDYIRSVVSECVTVIGENKQSKRTEKIDSIVTHPLFAIPIFFAVMFVVFQVTFGSFGSILSDFADELFNLKFAPLIENSLDVLGIGAFLKGLIVDGIIAGVGGVITFFPQIMLLGLFLSLLEDSGYMARTAFIMDKFLSRLGLSGKSFIPMIMGFGCNVPAMMAVRTLENERDRKLTMLLIPFMSCSAKMPVYALFTSVMFPKNAGTVTFSLYIIGILLAVISGLIFSRTVLKGDISPFILELPPYRMPTLRSTLTHMREKVRDFAMRVGTVIFLASIIIWLMQNLDFSLHMVYDSRYSIIGQFGQFIAPVFTPCGFGEWQAVVSLISGFMAKEAVISTMSILYGGNLADAICSVFTPLSAYSFLTFVLLYVPCVATVSALRTESNSRKLTAFSVIYQIGIAWLVSMLVYQVG
ncbi:MAG: ferrous iron transport protein B, partial [Clostridia bacterium]|nr:ferrous iron transport protein B [Clostridia bacterium]